MTRPRVFIINEPMRRGDTGEMERFMDFSPALEFGDLIPLLPAGRLCQRITDPIDEHIAALRAGLTTYTGCDFLVAVGEPWAIGAATALAARASGGAVNLLVWQRRPGQYQKVELNLS